MIAHKKAKRSRAAILELPQEKRLKVFDVIKKERPVLPLVPENHPRDSRNA